MRRISRNAIYVDNDSINTFLTKKSKSKVFLQSFSAFLLIFLSLISIASIHSRIGEAGLWGSQDHLGTNMDVSNESPVKTASLPLSNITNRQWTLQESYGQNMGYVSYLGEGNDHTEFLVGMQKLDPENRATTYAKNIESSMSQIKDIRRSSNYFLGGLTIGLADMALATSNAISSIGTTIAQLAFNPNFICQDANSAEARAGTCLNLIQTIGGNKDGQSSDGIIGVLTNSIYMQLIVIVVAITALWIIKKGIIDLKIREALYGALWLVLSFIIGLFFLLQPMLLAKAPMVVSSNLSACVIGAFNGDNCFKSNASSETLTNAMGGDAVCRSDGNTAGINTMPLIMNGMSCRIWKAFVLEPYSQGSFGTSFENLYTKTPNSDSLQVNQNLTAAISKAGLSPDDFCVSLQSSGSALSFDNRPLNMDSTSNKVCNIAAFQMMLQTQGKNAATNYDSNQGVNNQVQQAWYKVVAVAGSDQGLWSAWSPSTTSGLHKFGTSFVSTISALLGNALIVVIAVFTMVYYIGSIILMALAPIFFLIGVHPGQGKRLLLGWLEKVVSNVLKYIVSALFLLLTVLFYSAVLQNSANTFITLIFVLILTMALFMYRKEIVDLLGRANMGGERMSNRLTDRLAQGTKSTGRNAGNLALSAVAGAAAGSLASGSKNPLKGAGQGMRQSVMREVKSAPGLTGKALGGMATQYDRTKADNLERAKGAAKNAAAIANDANLERLDKMNDKDEAYSKFQDSAKDLRGIRDDYIKARDVQLKADDIRVDVSKMPDKFASKASGVKDGNHFGSNQIGIDKNVAAMIGIVDQMKKLKGDRSALQKVGQPTTNIDQKIDRLNNQRLNVAQDLVNNASKTDPEISKNLFGPQNGDREKIEANAIDYSEKRFQSVMKGDLEEAGLDNETYLEHSSRYDALQDMHNEKEARALEDAQNLFVKNEQFKEADKYASDIQGKKESIADITNQEEKIGGISQKDRDKAKVLSSEMNEMSSNRDLNSHEKELNEKKDDISINDILKEFDMNPIGQTNNETGNTLRLPQVKNHRRNK